MIPLTHGLILASVLFVLGLTGLVIRRNLLFMLISLEIMDQCRGRWLSWLQGATGARPMAR